MNNRSVIRLRKYPLSRSRVTPVRIVETSAPRNKVLAGSRRPWAGVACVVALLGLGVAGDMDAQGFPVRPVRIIIPLSPGGGTDTLTRIMTPRMSQLLGQQVIVENRPGAATQIGTELVAKSPPDGYTLLNTDTSFTTNPSLYPKLPYDSVKDFAPVSLLASAPVVLTVHPSVPAKTLKEILALARAHPGELNFAVGGYGTGTHLGAELFKSVAKIDFLIIPFKGGGPAVMNVVAGQVAMMFGGPASVKPFVTAGRLRAIAVTGEKRNQAFPDVPTFSETGLKGVDSGSYWGSLAPAATPKPIIATLSGAMAKALQTPEVRDRLRSLGYDPIGSTPEQYSENLRSEMAKWAKVVKAANIHLD